MKIKLMTKNKLILFVLATSLLISIGFNISSNISNYIKEDIITDSKIKSDENNLKYFTPNQEAIVGVYHKESTYSRLKLDDKENIRPQVWKLSENSSGVQIHFSSNSPTISVKLSLEEYSKMGNMNNIGKNGVDLYCWINNKWQFVDSGISDNENNIFILGQNLKGNKRQYLLNLPLYSKVNKVKIGIKNNTKISFGSNFKNLQPIVVYGTSITQGASASRPGMAYTNIISRNINHEVYNLGFSGNGLFESSIAEILCKMKPKIYIIDCTPNSSPEIIRNNAFHFIEKLYKCNPNVPILLVESIIRQDAYLNTADKNTFGGLKYINAQNNELRKVFEKAQMNGLKTVYYLNNENLIGDDYEATVDGTHLNDIGMSRIAEELENKIKEIIQL